MVALRDEEEAEAARLTLEFLDQFAKEVGGRAVYRAFSLEGEYTIPKHLVGTFKIEIKVVPQKTFFRRVFPFFQKKEKWEDVALFNFSRVDWDDSPHMQGAVCLLYHPEIISAQDIRKDVGQWVLQMFGCTHLRIFTPRELEKCMGLLKNIT